VLVESSINSVGRYVSLSSAIVIFRQHAYDTAMDHCLPFAQLKPPYMFTSVNNVDDDNDDTKNVSDKIY
jgi:hypothetical protein